ncbi:hypothetical protein SAMN05216404_108136 [Nitrosospira multiformis]|uniref:Uncharacterized protein n=1 Tax=Nitrosospira multiformis TaxID=1231 RepID=A0A1H8KH38_9PROT|nr:hypothetical protein SAMN05216404_108136 [Nitrosospira multiformis]
MDAKIIKIDKKRIVIKCVSARVPLRNLTEKLAIVEKNGIAASY